MIGRLGALAALPLVVVAVGFILLSGGSSYEVKAIFQNASQIVSGDEVQVAGNAIGGGRKSDGVRRFFSHPLAWGGVRRGAGDGRPEAVDATPPAGAGSPGLRPVDDVERPAATSVSRLDGAVVPGGA